MLIARSLVLALVGLTIGLAALVRAPSAFACSYAWAPDPIKSAEIAAVIVVARVVEVRENESVRLAPEAFLKGPVEPELKLAHYDTTCDLARLSEGERILVFFGESEATSWPQEHSTFRLRSGRVEHDWEGVNAVPEAELINELRTLTGQYAVPAATADEGAGIDWARTVLPVGAIVLAVFGVGLVLMRTWHRIDPS